MSIFIASKKMRQVNREKRGEKRKRETFICENEGRDGESCSGCNAVWNLLVMETGRNCLWILTVFCHWSILACHRCYRKKVLSHTRSSHAGILPGLLHRCWCHKNKLGGHHELVKGCLNDKKITELRYQTLLEQTIDWKIHRRKGARTEVRGELKMKTHTISCI